MTWQEFELLTGETFRRLGYSLAEKEGGEKIVVPILFYAV